MSTYIYWHGEKPVIFLSEEGEGRNLVSTCFYFLSKSGF